MQLFTPKTTPIDWKKGPGYNEITQINLPPFSEIYLDNKIKCILLNQGTQDILKLDIVYRGGRFLESKQLTANYATSLMREGTANYTSAQIANTFDYYGAALRMASNLDYTQLSVTCLTKHFAAICPILKEVIFDPLFEEDELRKQKKIGIEKLNQDLAKNDIISYRLFTEAIFGASHPYGYNSTADMITSLTTDDIRKYHQSSFGSNNCFIILSGKFDDEQFNLVNLYFGQHTNTVKNVAYQVIESNEGQTIYANTKSDLQASIKIGRQLFGRNHPDYAGFFVLNTILGGYFGSRLMTSIREDLGYTYNIYSALDYLCYDGYFYVGTEVGIEYLDKTMAQISVEMDQLRTKLVPRSELKMVKSYLLGNMLNLIDGPLNTSNLLKSLELDNTQTTDFYTLIEQIKSVSPKEILRIADTYLAPEALSTIVVKGSVGV